MAEPVKAAGKKVEIQKYSFTVTYVSGKEETIEVVNHKIIEMISNSMPNDPRTWIPNSCPYIEYVTIAGWFGIIPLTSIVSFKLDEGFSKVVEARALAQKTTEKLKI